MFGQSIGAQNIILDPNIDLITDESLCITVGEGRTITFESSLACSPIVTVTNEDGTETFFSTSESTFSYTFEDTGKFFVLCGNTVSSAGVPAACIIVEEAIPTLGEWGFIVLGLILLIFGTVALRNTENKQAVN